jgi:hypothetical protein
MPIVSGLAIGAALGAGIGGLSAALQHKDIAKGALFGGLTGAVTGGVGGAMGGAGSAVAEGALTSGEAATFMGSGALPTSMAPALDYGVPALTDGVGSLPLNQSSQLYANTPMSGNIAAGFNSVASDPMKYLGDNKMSLGLAGLAGGMAPAANQQNNNNQQDTTIHPYSYSAGLNPGYTGAGTPYFNQNYNKLPTYNVANGGILSLAEGGEAAPADSTALPAPVKKQPTLADYLAATRSATANARSIEAPSMQTNNVVVPTMQNQVNVPTMQNQVNVPNMQNQVNVPNMQTQYVNPQQQYTRPIQQVPQAVTDYNNTLAQRAQHEYVDSPQLGAFSSHLNDPAPKPANANAIDAMYQKYLGRNADPTGYAANKNASPEQIAYGIQTSPEYMAANPNAPKPVMPTATGPASYVFNPATGGYTTSYAPAAPDAGIASLQQPQQQPQQQYQPTGYDAYQGGAANGGLMSYAMGGGIGSYYPEPDDGQGGQHPQDTMMGAHPSVSMGPAYPMQGIKSNYSDGGGIYNLGGYSDGGRLLKGPGDGVSDDIPAQIGQRQPARLADGEFVVPARIVSELGNGSTDAGAKRLYAMMARVQANRKKTVGKGKVAVNSKSDQYLPT